MAKCRKCKPTECEECPEWIFTLADLIMCMMGLFVILWVLKPSEAPPPTAGGASTDGKQVDVKTVAAIREAFGYDPNPKSLDPVDIEIFRQRLEGGRPPMGPGEGSKTEQHDDAADGSDREVTKIREGDTVSSGTTLLFASGSAETTPAMAKLVKQLSEKIRGHKQIVLLKGHSSLDDLSEDAPKQELMELSSRRANAILELFVAEGVDREVLRPQGCSVFEPARARRFGADGQAPNRRVEVDVTDQLVEDRQAKTGRARAGQ